MLVRALVAGREPAILAGAFSARAFSAAAAAMASSEGGARVSTYTSLVPAQLSTVLDAAEGGDSDAARALAGFEAILVGGQALAPALREQLDAVASAVKKPLFLGSVPEDMMDLDYLSARNVRVCLQGHHQFWAGVQGVYNTLKALRDGTKPSKLPNVASADLQKKLLRQADYNKWSKDFLNTK